MSDVGTGSPPPSAPAAPSTPAPANEVVINPNPTSTPSPVGPQAPERPPGELDRGHGRPETRRESIRKAFERANAPEKEKTPAARKTEKAAKPVEGKTADQPLDLRKPPQAQERYREGGRFAKAPDQPASQTDPAAGQQPGQPQSASAQKPAAALPDDAPYRETPQRFSERGKAEWAATPEGVRGDVHRMAKEFEGAYTKLRGDHEEMNTIRNFHQMATEHGTTLQKALTNYVSMEQKLRADPIGGLDVIVSNLNLRTSDGKKLTLYDVAHHVMTSTPEQRKLVQTQNAGQAQSHQLGQLHQMVASLAQNVQQMHHREQFTQTRSQVDVFADSHPGFDELGDLIEQELQFGFSLEEAYQRAYRLRPPKAQAAQTRSSPAQTRPDKSIHGAPDGGPSNGPGPRRKGDKQVGRREAIQRAIQRVGGGV